MVAVRRSLVSALSKVSRMAGSQAKAYKLTYAAADAPFTTTAQHTVSDTWEGRVVVAPVHTDREPVEQQAKHECIVTVNAKVLGWLPTQADRWELGGEFYNVVQVMNIIDTIYKLRLSGPMADPVETGDVTAPRFTVFTITTGTTTFGFSGTINEASQYRIRYRNPPDTGTWNTGTWTVPYATSASGTVAVDSGTWEVQAQARDAAGNVGAWFSASPRTIEVTGIPS